MFSYYQESTNPPLNDVQPHVVKQECKMCSKAFILNHSLQVPEPTADITHLPHTKLALTKPPATGWQQSKNGNK